MLLMHIQKYERAIIRLETQQEEPVIDYGLVDEEDVYKRQGHPLHF